MRRTRRADFGGWWASSSDRWLKEVEEEDVDVALNDPELVVDADPAAAAAAGFLWFKVA